LNFTVILSDNKLFAVRSELNGRVNFVFIYFTTFFLPFDGTLISFVLWFISCVLVVAVELISLRVAFLDVVPEDDEAFTAGNSENSIHGRHGDGRDAGAEPMHQSGSLLFLRLDVFEDLALQLDHHGAAVRHDEIRALKRLLLEFLFLLLVFLVGHLRDIHFRRNGCAKLALAKGNTLDGAEIEVFKPRHDLELEVVESHCPVRVAYN